MYTEYYRHTSAKDNIARMLACHFTIEDLNKAKGVLMDKYGDIVNPERRKNQKDSQNRSEKVKICEDIIDILEDIDGQMNVMFTAHDWKSLPKCSPEEVSDLSVLQNG